LHLNIWDEVILLSIKDFVVIEGGGWGLSPRKRKEASFFLSVGMIFVPLSCPQRRRAFPLVQDLSDKDL